jgi:DNA-binding Lrp family transcriptional regulator
MWRVNWGCGVSGTMHEKAVELSLDDFKVIDVLRTQAKAPLAEIARQCGFTQQKVSRIIAKLEKNKVIWGYSAVIDDEACGLHHFYMLLKRNGKVLSETTRKEIEVERVEKLSAPDQRIIIENIQAVNGAYSVVFSFLAEDVTSARKFSNYFNKKYGEYFTEIVVMEDILTIRRQGQRNIHLKDDIEMLEYL